MRKLALTIILILVTGVGAHADEIDYVHVTIVDVGVGLCCVIEMPGKHYAIVDAGCFSEDGNQVIENQLPELIEPGSEVDLLLFSHPHKDHISAAQFICDNYQVKRVIRSGLEYPEIPITDPDGHGPFIGEITSGCEDYMLTDLGDYSDLPERTISFSEGENVATITFLSGFTEFPESWDDTGYGANDKVNAISIVARLDFAGRSVLFPGDALGYREPENPGGIDSTGAELYMYEQNKVTSELTRLDSDVIIAGHHGSRTSSSSTFINCVSPEYVIFSAGTSYKHPTEAAAERYIRYFGEDAINSEKYMFRTDWGDKKRENEWDFGSTTQADKPGDDDVEIWIYSNGNLHVAYSH